MSDEQAAPEATSEPSSEPAGEPATSQSPTAEPATAADDADDTAGRTGNGLGEAGDVPVGGVSNSQQYRDGATAEIVGNQVHGGHLVGATFVGGDQHLSFVQAAAAARLQPGELAKHIREQIESAYVKPEGFEAFQAEIGDRRAVIVRGPAGHGKTAAAIRLLVERRVERILLLRGAAQLDDLIEKIEPGIGYILYDLVDATEFTAHRFNALAASLDEKNSHLFVTVPSDQGLRDDELVEHARLLPPPPDHASIVRELLSWLSRDTGTAPTLDGLDELIEELFSDAAPRRHASELAQVIVRQYTKEGFDLDDVRSYMSARITEDFQNWFDNLPDLDHRCHAIALAAFNGLAYEYVTEALHGLKRRLEPPPHDALAQAQLSRATLRPGDDLGTTRRDRLRTLRAEAAVEWALGPHGTTRVEVVRFRTPGYARRVLHRAWSEFTVQHILLEWLAELSSHRSEAVRVWAATALGMLSTFSFDYVTDTIFTRWAGSRSASLREAVAFALHVPAADTELQPAVFRLVESWYRNGNNRTLQASAARAFGYSLGRHDPNRALAALNTLARIDNLRVSLAVGASLAELCILENAKYAEPILATIKSWNDDEDRTLTAQLAFIVMARGLVMSPVVGATFERSAVTSGRGRRTKPSAGARWPALLYLARDQHRLWIGLADLWYFVLAESNHFADLAMTAMHEWTRLVDRDADARAALAQLLVTITQTDPDLRRLLHEQTLEWSEPGTLNPPLDAIEAIQSALYPES
ncbi:hypothetical protein AB0J74_32855 [Asanoa sp. NPDC049573]|uniref:hypothetical protein n=1 Tax=Asanoa sp. NPDC049573 TaxID=3155396 RepID=UPI00342873E2